MEYVRKLSEYQIVNFDLNENIIVAFSQSSDSEGSAQTLTLYDIKKDIFGNLESIDFSSGNIGINFMKKTNIFTPIKILPDNQNIIFPETNVYEKNNFLKMLDLSEYLLRPISNRKYASLVVDKCIGQTAIIGFSKYDADYENNMVYECYNQKSDKWIESKFAEKLPFKVDNAIFSNDSKKLILKSQDNYIFNRESQKYKKCPFKFSEAIFSNSNNEIIFLRASREDRNKIFIYDINAEKIDTIIGEYINCIAPFSDGFVCGGDKGKILIYTKNNNNKSYKRTSEFKAFENDIKNVLISKKTRNIIISDNSEFIGKISYDKCSNGEYEFDSLNILKNKISFNNIRMSQDGNYFAISTRDQLIIFDVNTLKQIDAWPQRNKVKIDDFYFCSDNSGILYLHAGQIYFLQFPELKQLLLDTRIRAINIELTPEEKKEYYFE